MTALLGTVALADAAQRYRAVLRGRFAAVLAASVVGRLHESMVSFGVILLVTQEGTYARAGLAVAAYGVGATVAAPFAGRLADRFGHLRVLLVTAAAFAVAITAVGLVAHGPALLPVAVLAGVLNPPLTPAVRAWLPRLVPAEHRLTAFALESTLQEVVFVAGPVLAGAAALLAGPWAALAATAALTLAGTLVSCAVVRDEPWARRRPAVAGGVPGDEGADGAEAVRGAPDVPGGPGRLLTPEVWRLLAGGAGFLWVLSIAAVAIVAHVSGPQAQGSAGLYLALTSAGSMAGGLVFAARVRQGSAPAARFVVLGVAVVALATVTLTDATALLVVAAVAYGTAIAPVGTVLFGRLSEEAGDERAVEAFGWMGAAMGVGAVLGDASGGWLVTVVPPWAALAAAAVVAVGTAAAVRSPRCRGASPG